MKQWIKFCIQCNLVSNAQNLISYVVIWLKNSQDKFYFWSTMGKIISFVFNLIRYTHPLQVHWLGNLQFFLNVKHATNLASPTLFFLQELGKQYFVKVPKIKRQTKSIVKKNILPNLSDWFNFNSKKKKINTYNKKIEILCGGCCFVQKKCGWSVCN